MEKWNYNQPCDSVIGQLNAYMTVEGGRSPVTKKSSHGLQEVKINQGRNHVG